MILEALNVFELKAKVENKDRTMKKAKFQALGNTQSRKARWTEGLGTWALIRKFSFELVKAPGLPKPCLQQLLMNRNSPRNVSSLCH